MEVVAGTIVPVFAVVAVGYWLAGRGIDARTLADLALWVTSPALLFSLLSGTPLDAARLTTLAGGTVSIVAGTGLAAALYVRATSVGRGFLLPAVFFNGGNMGLACSRLAFGAEGLEAAAVPFVTIALCTSSGTRPRLGSQPRQMTASPRFVGSPRTPPSWAECRARWRSQDGARARTWRR